MENTSHTKHVKTLSHVRAVFVYQNQGRLGSGSGSGSGRGSGRGRGRVRGSVISIVCTQSIKIICVLCYFTSEVVIQMQRVGWGSGRGGGGGGGGGGVSDFR